MEGSILPGWARDSGVYRPRRCSREQTCPVTNTEPCACGAAAAAQLSFALRSASPVAVARWCTGWTIGLGIAASHAPLEGEELVMRRLVPALDQGRRRCSGGVGH